MNAIVAASRFVAVASIAAGPCPVCGGTDRFSVNIAKQVFRTKAIYSPLRKICAIGAKALGAGAASSINGWLVSSRLLSTPACGSRWWELGVGAASVAKPMPQSMTQLIIRQSA